MVTSIGTSDSNIQNYKWEIFVGLKKLWINEKQNNIIKLFNLLIQTKHYLLIQAKN